MPSSEKERRLGVVAIIVKDREGTYMELNKILHNFADVIVGRLGIPYRERNMSVMALVVDGNTDEIGAMTGKIGQIRGVSVKTAFAKL